jgi:hypothetical protein
VRHWQVGSTFSSGGWWVESDTAADLRRVHTCIQYISGELAGFTELAAILQRDGWLRPEWNRLGTGDFSLQ